MKQFMKYTFLLVNLFSITLFATQSGQLTTLMASGGGTFYGLASWYSSSASYQNGGVTFTFPDGFSDNATPVVVATVQPASYSSSSKYDAFVTSVSSSGVTIRVNDDSGEASTDEVIVHVFVIGTME
jgi:hypothetical protein